MSIATGPNLPFDLAEQYSVELTHGLGVEVYVVAGGMEDIRSAYLMLSINDRKYLLLERKNDDGEWAPQLFDSPDHSSEPQGVYRNVRRVGAHADEPAIMDLARRWDVSEELACDFLRDSCWEALYGFRDDLLRLMRAVQA